MATAVMSADEIILTLNLKEAQQQLTHSWKLTVCIIFYNCTKFQSQASITELTLIFTKC
jgi:hypothetical protein